MSYKLVKVTPNCSESGDIKEDIAYSNSYHELSLYCAAKFDKWIGKPEKFCWFPYYIIEKTKAVVI